MDQQRYINVITDLLGADAVSELTRSESVRTDLFSNGVPTLSDAAPYARIAEFASTTLTGAKLEAFVGCPAAAQDETCARTALTGLMERAFRRPVDVAEVDALMSNVFALGAQTSFENGVQRAVQAILQSGSTLYLKEFGVSGGQGVSALDQYEVASQISFFLLDSLPDAELMDAARNGQLATPEQIQTHVQRLIANENVQAKLSELLLRQFHLDDIKTTTAVDGIYQELFTDSLRESFYWESQFLVDDVLWRNPRSTFELIRSDKTFVNQELAEKVYNVAYTGPEGGFMPITVPPERAVGVLAHGSFLAGKAKANTGSVVKRGKSIRMNFLCLGPPPPPPLDNPGVKEKLEEQEQSTLSEAELAAERAGDPVCKACHATFDPLGLALNQFDRIGRLDPAVSVETAELGGVDGSVWEGSGRLGFCGSWTKSRGTSELCWLRGFNSAAFCFTPSQQHRRVRD
jgi:hypothetical protein